MERRQQYDALVAVLTKPDPWTGALRSHHGPERQPGAAVVRLQRRLRPQCKNESKVFSIPGHPPSHQHGTLLLAPVRAHARDRVVGREALDLNTVVNHPVSFAARASARPTI